MTAFWLPRRMNYVRETKMVKERMIWSRTRSDHEVVRQKVDFQGGYIGEYNSVRSKSKVP
jgi:hypothetical protein